MSETDSILGSTQHKPQPNSPSKNQPDQGTITGALVRDLTEDNFDEALELSRHVPIILDMWAPWCGPCRQLGPALEEAVKTAGGRVGLAKVNVDENPALSQAFQVQSIPAVFLLLNGQPASLFTGAVPASALKQVIDKVIELADSQGVTATLTDPNSAPNLSQNHPDTPDSDPELQTAQSHLEAGEFAQAIDIYENFLKTHPEQGSAVEPLAAKARLGQRCSSASVDPQVLLRQGDTADTTDVAAQLAAADTQMSAGDAAGALSRLLAVVAQTKGEDRDSARKRLVEYFTILGDDPIVAPIRAKLSALLY